MNKHNSEKSTIQEPLATRRRVVKTLGSALASVPVLGFMGCGTPSGASSSVQSSSASSEPSSSSLSSSSSSSVLSSSSSVSSSSSSRPSVDGWASGGTASIWTDFPPANPFAGSTPSQCSPTGDLLLGPCYFSLDHLREDISDGELGVPVIFAIQALDSQCRPLSGVVIDVWHTNCEGFYSADASGAAERSPNWDGPFCANYDQRAQQSRWHRGAQVSNSEGAVYFKSCFPGWYAGRTNHIHLRFVRDGNEILATQFAFADALNNEIHVNHPEYIGQVQDTSLSADGVFSGGFGFGGGGGGSSANWVMDTSRNEDGSMLASKSVILNV